MVEVTALVPTGRRMTYEQYLDLPDEVRAEYVDGEALMNLAPSFRHQEVCLRLADLLRAQLGPAAVVALAVGWQLADRAPKLRIPDLVVLERRPDSDLVTTAPLVAVEVMSSNRRNDLVRKSTEYLAAGVQQYWIVDLRDRGISVYSRAEGGWELLADLTSSAPTATVEIPPFGSVNVSLAELLD